MTAPDVPPTRVAMDVTSLLGPVTGVGQMVRHLAARLPRYPGLDLTGLLISFRGRGQLGQVIPPGWATRTVTLPARFAHLAWQHVDWPRARGFDVVHGPNFTVPPTDGAARLVTVHDLSPWRFPELVDDHSRRYPRHLARAVADGAHVHVVSDFVGQELQDELGIDPERIHVVNNGIGPAPAGDGARGRDLVGGRYVLAIGTLEPRKDHVSLIRAMAAIWPIFDDLQLVIAGPPGSASAEVDQVIDELGVADRVRRLGYVSDPVRADLLAGAELLAFPSIYEGFGLPILEAMQVGLPVVASRAGAIPEVAGRAAVLVEPRDPSALAGALLTVLEDDALRRHLADAGLERVQAYSWDRAADELVGLYRQLAGTPEGSLQVA